MSPRFNKRRRPGVSALLALAGVIACVLALQAGGAKAAGGNGGPLQLLGTVNLSALPDTTGSAAFAGFANEVSPNADDGLDAFDTGINTSGPDSPSASIPTPAGTPIVTSGPELTNSFQGLDHFDTRTRDGGNAFSLEPPDQGLCVGGNQVIETVNDVMTVYDTGGNQLTAPVSMNTFFGLPFAINRTTLVRGPFLSDPKCYYDVATNRFFLTMLEEDPAPSVRAHTLIAVSETSDARGAWRLYSLDATDDGLNGTPSHPGCPCFGDQPLIGADQNGFYISTNEFGAGFNGAQIYAMSKTALEQGNIPPVVHLQGGPLAEGLSYSVQPATSPTGAQSPGIEYFLSALQFGPSPSDNRIAAWAMTNTGSLNSATPNVQLTSVVIPSESYTQPNPATQKAGPYPLGQFFGDAENTLNSNDDRMNQVVYVKGALWSGVNTEYQDANGNDQSGIAWFEVAPSVSGAQVSAHVLDQGYVAPTGENVLFPSIGVTASGRAVMSMTLSGPDYYPSAAYSVFDGSGFNSIKVASAGVGPADGFTGYPAEGGNGVERWGDYSAAVAGPGNTVWLATEYIAQTCTESQWLADSTCGGTRTQLANWSTRISAVKTTP